MKEMKKFVKPLTFEILFVFIIIIIVSCLSHDM